MTLIKKLVIWRILQQGSWKHRKGSTAERIKLSRNLTGTLAFTQIHLHPASVCSGHCVRLTYSTRLTHSWTATSHPSSVSTSSQWGSWWSRSQERWEYTPGSITCSFTSMKSFIFNNPVFGRWEESGEPSRTPHGHGKKVWPASRRRKDDGWMNKRKIYCNLKLFLLKYFHLRTPSVCACARAHTHSLGR